MDGEAPAGVTAKDIVLAIIGRIGTGGGIGHIIELPRRRNRGAVDGRPDDRVQHVHRSRSAKAGLVAPDETTFDYLAGRRHVPTGSDWDAAVADWRSLVTDDGAAFDRSVSINAAALRPHVTWGTNPAHVIPIDGTVPAPGDFDDPVEADSVQRALDYMGLDAGARLSDVAVDTVFIGSCTNSRIEDLRAAACSGPGPQGGGRREDAGGAKARSRSRRRQKPRAWTRCSPTPASTGESRAARCASR